MSSAPGRPFAATAGTTGFGFATAFGFGVFAVGVATAFAFAGVKTCFALTGAEDCFAATLGWKCFSGVVGTVRGAVCALRFSIIEPAPSASTRITPTRATIFICGE